MNRSKFINHLRFMNILKFMYPSRFISLSIFKIFFNQDSDSLNHFKDSFSLISLTQIRPTLVLSSRCVCLRRVSSADSYVLYTVPHPSARALFNSGLTNPPLTCTLSFFSLPFTSLPRRFLSKARGTSDGDHHSGTGHRR